MVDLVHRHMAPARQQVGVQPVAHHLPAAQAPFAALGARAFVAHQLFGQIAKADGAARVRGWRCALPCLKVGGLQVLARQHLLVKQARAVQRQAQ